MSFLRETLKAIKGSQKAVERAKRSALSEIAKHGNTLWRRQIAQTINVPQKYIRASMQFSLSPDFATISVDSRKSTIKISRFRGIPMLAFQGTRQTARGVKFKPLKQGPAITLESHFINRVDSGQTFVFRRISAKRYPIYKAYDKSIEGVAAVALDSVIPLTTKKWPAIFESKIKYFLSKELEKSQKSRR